MFSWCARGAEDTHTLTQAWGRKGGDAALSPPFCAGGASPSPKRASLGRGHELLGVGPGVVDGCFVGFFGG